MVLAILNSNLFLFIQLIFCSWYFLLFFGMRILSIRYIRVGDPRLLPFGLLKPIIKISIRHLARMNLILASLLESDFGFSFVQF